MIVMGVNDVANWFLCKESMSPKKVQKLVYYAYAWCLTLMNDSADDWSIRLFGEEIKDWIHGPVIPSLYQRFKEYGYQNIPQPSYPAEIKNEDILDVLNQVWDIYGGYNANQLENITHQEEPWIKAREGVELISHCNNTIKDKVIFNYYMSWVVNE